MRWARMRAWPSSRARSWRALLDGHARMRAHLTLRELAAPAVLGLVAYLFEALALQVLARGMGHDVGFGLAVLAIALADVAGMLSFIPGGIGVAEGGLMIVLTLHGMPLADATVLTLLFRLCTLWFGLSLGAAAAAALEVGARRAGRKA
ncbi:MAG TPA: flippase-like domain-containing protein [Candidatus Thermoplasmatota archaeon]|nr:flippase-like domain-containing protein [Candidatus Thermoplasmatota archaeon]